MSTGLLACAANWMGFSYPSLGCAGAFWALWFAAESGDLALSEACGAAASKAACCCGGAFFAV
jgi:hypothetical protein